MVSTKKFLKYEVTLPFKKEREALVSELTRFEKVPGDGVQVLILFKSDPSTNVMLMFWRTKDDDPIATLISCAWSVKCTQVHLVHWPRRGQQVPLQR